MNRRTALKAGAAALGGIAAGCLEYFETESVWRDAPLVEDRPDAVYLPAGIEEMGTYGRAEAGEYTVALTYTFPHRFWNVSGDRERSNRVEVSDEDTLHLMLTVWDPETGTVLPVEPTVELRRDGERVTTLSPWTMLSQRMGFHHGDNVSLPEEGEYVAAITIPPVDDRLVGDLAGRFDETATAEIAFEYETDDVYDLEYTPVDEDRRGERGALDLMHHDGGYGDGSGRKNGGDHSPDDHDHGGHDHDDGEDDASGDGHAIPVSTVPDPEELPGTLLGTDTSGDAVFAIAALEDPGRFADDGTYLLVSPRTPYNSVPLPEMSLAISVARDGEVIVEERPTMAVDPEVGIHYGVTVEPLRTGDEVTIEIEVPPQVARHDGYETAFFDMPPVELTGPE